MCASAFVWCPFYMDTLNFHGILPDLWGNILWLSTQSFPFSIFPNLNSFNIYLFSAYHLPDTGLGAGNTEFPNFYLPKMTANLHHQLLFLPLEDKQIILMTGSIFFLFTYLFPLLLWLAHSRYSVTLNEWMSKPGHWYLY